MDVPPNEQSPSRPTGQDGFPLVLAVAAVGLLIVLCGGGAVVGWRMLGVAPPAATPPDRTRVYSREEFTRLVVGKRSEEFVRDLGWGDRKGDTDEFGRVGLWYYERRTRHPATGDLDAEAEVVFKDG